MSSICGIYKRDERKADNDEIDQMLHQLNHWDADYTDKTTHGPIGFGHLMLYNTPESKNEILPFHDKENGLIIVADARIDNREELLEKTGLTDAANISDSQLILKAFKIYNKRCVDHLVGAFAFSVWDEHKQELFCARDHIGFKPFYYYLDNNIFLFGTETRHITNYPVVDASINEQYIADALSTLKSENDQTFYKAIKKLPPAHYLIIKPEFYEFKRYWDLNPKKEIKYNTEEEYIEHFKALLNQAVKCRLRSAYQVGSELSGGLDSSAVTGFASQYTNINTFSHILPDWAHDKIFPYEDERQFIEQVNQYCKIRDNYYITGEQEGILKSLKRGISINNGIVQASLSLFSDALYKKAQETGTRTLLSGFGGDELVSYKGGGVFKELAYHFHFRKLLKEITYKRHFLSAFKQLVLSIGSALTDRFKQLAGKLSTYKTPGWAHDIYGVLFLNPDFFQRMQMKERFYKRKKLPDDPSVRMKQYRRFHYSYFPGRLEDCYASAQAQKVEYRYPLLDKRLLEFYLALPVEIKKKHGWGRYILRKSMQDLVPEEIQWRNDKMGATVPNVFLRLNQDYEQIKKLLKETKNKDITHYIDYDKALEMLDKMINRTRETRGRIVPVAFYSAIMLILYQTEDY
jgi:asparagine synthase (glutamine-hydrolysing)